MTMQAVSIKIPDTIAEYTLVEDEHDALTRNAMILFPYIKKEVLSHGKAAGLLGIHKIRYRKRFRHLTVIIFQINWPKTGIPLEPIFLCNCIYSFKQFFCLISSL